MEDTNQRLIEGINKGNVGTFEELYNQYYVFLCLIADHIVSNPSDAEDIVSDVFVKLWNIRESINIRTSIKAYLIKAVHNTSINHLESIRHKNELTEPLDSSDYKLLAWDSDYPLGQLYEKEILDILDQSIKSLPDGCRQIFLLSRNENLKYSEIAEKLSISVNTVKTQIKIALAHLRANLKNYLMVLFTIMGLSKFFFRI